MSAHLIIEDGQPWWDSTDIWVVPGNDPNGPPGAPVAGTANYLWGRVHNTGDSASNGVRVDFYWADPSGQIAVGAATQIGSAFADLPPGATQEVLCLVPWVPVIVNGGHECLLAVAHGPGDINPLPDPMPSGFLFQPTLHEQIAQRNVTVVLAARRAQLLTIAVGALPRETKKVELQLEYGGELPERLLATLGLERWQPAREAHLIAGLARTPHCNGDTPGEQKLALDVPRGKALAVYLSVRAQALPPRQYALLRVLESQEGKLMGGITYIVTDQEKEQAQEQAQEQHSPEEQAS